MILERDIQFRVTYPLYVYKRGEEVIKGCHDGSIKFDSLNQAIEFFNTIDKDRKIFSFICETYSKVLDVEGLEGKAGNG